MVMLFMCVEDPGRTIETCSTVDYAYDDDQFEKIVARPIVVADQHLPGTDFE